MTVRQTRCCGQHKPAACSLLRMPCTSRTQAGGCPCCPPLPQHPPCPIYQPLPLCRTSPRYMAAPSPSCPLK